jgi:ABC-type cobalamin/Fe3+-siderophores transport system ATPase subunit
MKYKIALMKQLRAFTGTTIVVLHDLNLAAQYCDHVVIMNEGTILKEGSPTEVLTPEILEPIFEVPFKTSWDEGRYHLYY